MILNRFTSPTSVSSLNPQDTILRLFPIPGIFESSSPILFTGFNANPPSYANSLKSPSFAAISNFEASEKISFIVFSEASIFLVIEAILNTF